MISIMSKIALTAIPTVTMVLSMMPHSPTGFSPDFNHDGLSKVLSAAAATRRMNQNAGRGGIGFTTNSTTVQSSSSSTTARTGSVDYMSTFSQQQRSNLSYIDTDSLMANLVASNPDMLQLLPPEQLEAITDQVQGVIDGQYDILQQLQSDPVQFCQVLIQMPQEKFDDTMKVLAKSPVIEQYVMFRVHNVSRNANPEVQMEIKACGYDPKNDCNDCNEGSSTDEGNSSDSGDDDGSDGSGSNTSSEEVDDVNFLNWTYTAYVKFYEDFYSQDERYRVVCKEVGVVLLYDYLKNHEKYEIIKEDESSDRGEQETSTEPAEPENKDLDAMRKFPNTMREIFQPHKLEAWWEKTRENIEFANLIVYNGIMKLGGAFVKLSQVFPEKPCGTVLFELLKKCKDEAEPESDEVIEGKFREIQGRLKAFDRGSQVINPNMKWKRKEMCNDINDIDIVQYNTKSLGSASIGTIHVVTGIRYSEAQRKAYIGQLTEMDPSKFVDDEVDEDELTQAETGMEFSAIGNVVVKVRRAQVVNNTTMDSDLWDFVQRKVDEFGDMTKNTNYAVGNNDKYQLVQTEINKCFKIMWGEFDYTAEAKYTAIAHEVLKKIAKQQKQQLAAKRTAIAKQGKQQHHSTNAELILYAPKVYQEIDANYIFMENVPGVTLNKWANQQAEKFKQVISSHSAENSADSIEIEKFMTKYYNDLEEIGTALVVSIWTVVFEGGFIHMDAHSGNIMFDETQRKLTLLDFGMVQEIHPNAAAKKANAKDTTARQVTISEAFRSVPDFKSIAKSILRSGQGKGGPDFVEIGKKISKEFTEGSILAEVMRSLMTTIQTIFSLCIEKSNLLDDTMKEKFFEYYFKFIEPNAKSEADRYVEEQVQLKLQSVENRLPGDLQARRILELAVEQMSAGQQASGDKCVETPNRKEVRSKQKRLRGAVQTHKVMELANKIAAAKNKTDVIGDATVADEEFASTKADSELHTDNVAIAGGESNKTKSDKSIKKDRETAEKPAAPPSIFSTAKKAALTSSAAKATYCGFINRWSIDTLVIMAYEPLGKEAFPMDKRLEELATTIYNTKGSKQKQIVRENGIEVLKEAKKKSSRATGLLVRSFIRGFLKLVKEHKILTAAELVEIGVACL